MKRYHQILWPLLLLSSSVSVAKQYHFSQESSKYEPRLLSLEDKYFNLTVSNFPTYFFSKSSKKTGSQASNASQRKSTSFFKRSLTEEAIRKIGNIGALWGFCIDSQQFIELDLPFRLNLTEGALFPINGLPSITYKRTIIQPNKLFRLYCKFGLIAPVRYQPISQIKNNRENAIIRDDESFTTARTKRGRSKSRGRDKSRVRALTPTQNQPRANFKLDVGVFFVLGGYYSLSSDCCAELSFNVMRPMNENKTSNLLLDNFVVWPKLTLHYQIG